MSAALVAILGLAAMYAGYRYYSKFIAERIYRLDPDYQTPSHAMQDGLDYVPTNLRSRNYFLAVVDVLIILATVWVMFEAASALAKERRERAIVESASSEG